MPLRHQRSSVRPPPQILPPQIPVLASNLHRAGPSVRPVALDRPLSRRKRRRSWIDFAKLQRQRLAALKDAPPWLISLIFHLALMLALALVTLQSSVGNSLLLTFTQGGDSALTTIANFSLQPIELDAASLDETTLPELSLQQVDIDAAIKLPVLNNDLASVTKLSKLDSLADSQHSSASSSNISNMFSGRTGALKQLLLKRGGGTRETEDAVALGLAWLKRQQRPDGSWSMVGPYAGGSRAENQTAATSMAMLAFMGAGSTHKSGEYQPVLNKAVKWLVKQQDSSGFMAQRARGNERMYAQAQATIALCELYGMTRDYWIRPYAQKACDFACQAQSPEGGWRYVPRFDSDTSVTGWFVMGLKSGHAAGLDISTSVFPKVEQYLDSVGSDYNSVYAYRVGEHASPPMTAEGMLCRQYLGWHRNMPGMAQGLGSLVANHPLDSNRSDVYYWYYATQSLHHYGGPLWEKWNERLRVDVPANQEKQGAERGSWSPHRDAWGAHAGRLYTTCLSLFCLEVYYRHMPLYGPEGEATAAK